MASIKIEKQADIRYRVELKNRPQVVVYKVRSSDDTQDYEVTIVRGKVNNCSCISRKPCYHMTGVAAKELDYQDRKREEEKATMDTLVAEMLATSAQAEKPAVARAERGLMHRDVKMVSGVPMR